MKHDCEFNAGLSSSPSEYRQCGKPAVTWVRGDPEENPYYLCAEHYDVVVAKHPELEGTI